MKDAMTVEIKPTTRSGIGQAVSFETEDGMACRLLFSYNKLVAYKVRGGKDKPWRMVRTTESPSATTERHIEPFAAGCSQIVGVPDRMLVAGAAVTLKGFVEDAIAAKEGAER